MKQSLFMMGLLCGLMTFVGCVGVSVNSIENANKSARMRIIADARVETDLQFADDFGVVRINTAPNASGFLRVQMEMENFTRDRMTVTGQMEWYDGDAMRIETASGGWQQYTFEPRESRSITFTAPTPDARDFRFKLQALDD